MSANGCGLSGILGAQTFTLAHLHGTPSGFASTGA